MSMRKLVEAVDGLSEVRFNAARAKLSDVKVHPPVFSREIEIGQDGYLSGFVGTIAFAVGSPGCRPILTAKVQYDEGFAREQSLKIHDIARLVSIMAADSGMVARNSASMPSLLPRLWQGNSGDRPAV